jgi:anti-sigma factor RsiW
MSCNNSGEKLSAYVDGELGYEERTWLEKHLLECPSCSEQLEEMRRVESFKPLLEPPEVPEEKWRDCWNEIKKQTTDSLPLEKVQARVASRRRAYWLRRALAGAGTAAVIAVVVVLLWSGEAPEAPAPPPPSQSVCIHDWDDSKYNLNIIDTEDYTIVKLMPIKEHDGG